MSIPINHPHDKFFKRNLKEKKIAIDFLKAYLPPVIYQSIALETLKLTEKSFVIPVLREIHNDIICQCNIHQKPGYLFFLVGMSRRLKMNSWRFAYYSIWFL